MGADTKIAWATHSWSPWWGCRKTSPGCANCYAETLSKRFGHDCFGDSPRRMLSESHWLKPGQWNRKAAKTGSRVTVFPSMCDPFEDILATSPLRGPGVELMYQRLRLFRLIRETPALTWLLLTKRPENVREMVPWKPGEWPANCWLGFTAEDQERLEERWPQARDAGAPLTFLSHEPGLGPIDIRSAMGDTPAEGESVPAWIITGGESGPRARPYDLAWPRSIVAQCKAAGVPVFVKQLGATPITTEHGADIVPIHMARTPLIPRDHGYPVCLKDRAGANPAEWPEDLRVQEYPAQP